MSLSNLRGVRSAIAENGRSLRDSDPVERAGVQGLIALTEAVLSGRGEASGAALARAVLERFEESDQESKTTYFKALAERFGSDHQGLVESARRYLKDPSSAHAMALHEAAEPRRQELIRRLNRAQNGTAALVDMRRQLIGLLQTHPEFAEVDHDFHHLLSSWFNRGFLFLQRIDWSTPANILEKIIRYEAVHEILSWDDLRRRIEPPDRRCYAFFHPNLTDQPLIFVSVALTQGIPVAIAPILSEERKPITSDAADTAVFYSISNCQQGLQGVSFGNFLIKQVVEELARDLPGLRNYVTLSPVPGFRRWLNGVVEQDRDRLLKTEDRETLTLADEPEWHLNSDSAVALEKVIMPLATYYFLRAKRADGALDPVARFHLGNGARLERVNWLADVSTTGLTQAAGLMVNYLYDLQHIESNHEAFVDQGEVVASDGVKAWLEVSSLNQSGRQLGKADAGTAPGVPGKE